jgi:hypothetical protein
MHSQLPWVLQVFNFIEENHISFLKFLLLDMYIIPSLIFLFLYLMMETNYDLVFF